MTIYNLGPKYDQLNDKLVTSILSDFIKIEDKNFPETQQMNHVLGIWNYKRCK